MENIISSLTHCKGLVHDFQLEKMKILLYVPDMSNVLKELQSLLRRYIFHRKFQAFFNFQLFGDDCEFI